MPLSAPRVVPRGAQEVAVHPELDGILGEVVVRAFVLLADHVHMGLQAERGAAFLAGGGRLADDHIADLIPLDLAAEGLGLAGHPVGRGGLVLGSAGDLRQFQEIGPDRLGFEGFEQCVHRTSRRAPDPRPGRQPLQGTGRLRSQA